MCLWVNGMIWEFRGIRACGSLAVFSLLMFLISVYKIISTAPEGIHVDHQFDACESLVNKERNRSLTPQQ